MKKYQYIKYQHLFQGEYYLNKKHPYFEGWYFKITCDQVEIAFIPGIQINQKQSKAFIQIITNEKSYNIDYSIHDFYYQHSPFYIKIGENYFSKDKIKIAIQDLSIQGTLVFFDSLNIHSNFWTPNIMGPFSFLPFMECNHAIVQMKGKARGYLEIQDNSYLIHQGTSYIEKDWGTSFPSSYLWLQANDFQNEKVSFMMSIATIPFAFLNFTGLICTLLIDSKEYRFATYNLAKIVDYHITDHQLMICIKKGCLTLTIEALLTSKYQLLAPMKGEMNRKIEESICSVIHLVLKQHDQVIFEDTSLHCGLEIAL